MPIISTFVNITRRQQFFEDIFSIMSLPVTEVVVLTLQSGANPEEPLNGLSKILHRQAGFQRLSLGPVEGVLEQIPATNW